MSASASGGRLPGMLVDAVAPLLVGIVAFSLARSVLLPGQGFWDTGEFQTVLPVLGTAHSTGYPTYVILGWLASLALGPLGEPAMVLNLLSALFLGAAAGLTVVLVRGLTGRTSVGIGAGILLALTPIPWRMGAIADPHTLHLALVAALLTLLLGWERRRIGSRRAGREGPDPRPQADRWLLAAAALFGVLLGNHTSTILLAPGIAFFVLAVEPGIVRRLRFLSLCVAVLLGTTVVLYLELPIRAAMGAELVYGTPNTWDGFWYVVLAEQFRGDLVNPFGDLARKAADLASLASAQLGVLAIAVPVAFLVTAVRRPRFALLTGTWLIVVCWFAASYVNGSIERYYLVPALIAILWLGVAAGLLVDALAPELETRSASEDEGDTADQGGRARPADEPDGADDPRPADEPGGLDEPGGVRAPRGLGAGGWVGLVASLVGVVLAAGLVLPAVVAAPDTRTRVDQSHDTRASDWSRWALETVGSDGMIVSWWSYSTPLWYRTIVLGERPDVRVLDDRDRLDEGLGSLDDVIRANIGERPVYLVRPPSEIAALERDWQIEEIPDPLGQQPLYRVVGPQPAGSNGAAPATIRAMVARMGR